MRSDNKTSVIANAYLDMLQQRFAPVEETKDEEVTAEAAEETTEVDPALSAEQTEEDPEGQNEVDSSVVGTEESVEEEESIFSPSELDAIKRHMD
jgi:hypothetical protein